MKRSKHIIAFCLILSSLLLGLVIYLKARDGDLAVNQIFGDLRYLIAGVPDFSSYWVIYSLPDALWMFALGIGILAVWNFTWTTWSVFWFLTALGFGIAAEFLHGTFDIVDLTSIAIAGILPIMFTLQFNHHEKSV